jgi:hypothetical protein
MITFAIIIVSVLFAACTSSGPGSITGGLPAGGNNADKPRLAMNATGYAFAVWEQDDGTNTDIWANIFSSGSG